MMNRDASRIRSLQAELEVFQGGQSLHRRQDLSMNRQAHKHTHTTADKNYQLLLLLFIDSLYTVKRQAVALAHYARILSRRPLVVFEETEHLHY